MFRPEKNWRRLLPVLLVMIGVCGQSTGTNFADAQELVLLDGRQIKSTVESINKLGMVAGPGLPERLKLEEVVSIDNAVKQTDSKSRIEIQLVGGSRLPVQSVESNGSALILTMADQSLKQIPLDLLKSITWKTTETVTKTIQDQSTDEDQVVVNTAKGERIVGGVFEGIANGKVQINFQGKSRKIDVSKVLAIVMADLGNSLAGGQRASLQLAGGGILQGVIRSLANDRVMLAVTTTSDLNVKFSAVKRIDLQSDNLIYLSDVQPVSTEQKPIFAPVRPWQSNLSLEGNPIRLRWASQKDSSESKGDQQRTARTEVRTYLKGIGTQSYSQLVFENTNQFTRFQAIAGIDFETGGRGDCQMSVVADGITLWSKRIRGSDPSVPIDVDITGMQKIELIVEPGEDFDLADHADWADAKFVKTRP